MKLNYTIEALNYSVDILPGAYIVTHKLLVCNTFNDYKVLWLSCVHWSIQSHENGRLLSVLMPMKPYN